MKFINTLLIICVMSISFGCDAIKNRKLKSDFTTAALEYRPCPLWFWNNTEITADSIVNMMEDISDKCGYGGVSILPFGGNFKPDYLSEEYFDRYATVLKKAKELNLKVCIYDEYGFPSGSAGYYNGDGFSRFVDKYPQYAMKSLFRTEYAVDGNSELNVTLPTEGDLMSVVAMDTSTFKLINLTPQVKDSRLVWSAPEGSWKVIAAICKPDGEQIVDYMDPEGAKCFVEMTHDQYYNRFKEYFGNVIEGTFFDEPTLYRKGGSNWTPLFNEKFEAKYGFSPELLYPALWYNIGASTEAARNYLFGFRSELYAAGFTKVVSDWSLAHGVTATGHQDNEERINPVGTSGDLMLSFKYLDIPGIDKIGGDRPAEDFYKIVSSSAYNWDRSFVMSETYGAMGDIEWNEIFSIAMDQYAKGINVLIPHAVWYDDTNVTFRPELSHRHPKYADSIRVFTDYLTRLNVLLANDGRVVNNVAVYYPIETLQGEHYLEGPLDSYMGGVDIPNMDYVQVGKILSDQICRDYTFIHPEVMQGNCSVKDGQMSLDNKVQFNSYKTLIFPSCKTMSLANLQKAMQMYNEGGTIVFTTQLPSKATIESEDAQLVDIIEKLFSKGTVGVVNNSVGGRALFIEQPNQAEITQALVTNTSDVTFDGEPLRYIHKIVDGKHRYFFANPSPIKKSTKALLSDNLKLEQWNPHTGDIVKVNNGSKNSELTIELEPYTSTSFVEL